MPSVSLPRGGLLPLSRGRFPMSGGNGRRPKEVGMMSRSDRGDRDRRPNAHTGADEVRPSKPPVPSTDHRNRAAQCAAPTGWSGFPATGDRKGRPYGFTRACLNPRAGGSRTRPYGVSGSSPSFCVGPVPDRPADNGPAITCSARPGAEMEPQQLQFLLNPGPSGPVGI